MKNLYELHYYVPSFEIEAESLKEAFLKMKEKFLSDPHYFYFTCGEWSDIMEIKENGKDIPRDDFEKVIAEIKGNK